MEIVFGSVESLQFEKMPNLRLIQTVSAGVNALPWTKIPKNVTVCSNIGAYNDVVSEHAWALILTLARNLHVHIPQLRHGTFNQQPDVDLLSGKTLGIIGVGQIGSRIAELGKAFHMRTIGVSRTGTPNKNCDVLKGEEYVDTLLAESDVVVVAAALTKSTRNMITLRRLSLMKKNCILVNIARAEIINRDDLITFLKQNPEFRIASDVWWNTNKEFSKDALFVKYPNFIGTPWVAGSNGSQAIYEQMVEKACSNIVTYLDGGKPRGISDRTQYT